MPNWCFTHITFHSQNEAAVKDWHAKILHYTSISANGQTDPYWLGNLLLHANLGSYDEIINDKFGYCRGWVNIIGDDVQYSNGCYHFYITVQDAWAPHTEPFYHLLGKLYNHEVEMAFVADEPGCELFLKYDPTNLFYSECEYVVDSFFPEAECEEKYYDIADMNGPQTFDVLSKAFGLDSWEAISAKAEEITEEMQDKYGDGFYYINEYEVMDNPF